METIVANLIGRVRYEHLNGRQYLVAPLTSIVPGVLNGSKGALYYPPEAIQSSVKSWDDIPIVIYHPIDPVTNAPLSANDPGVLKRQGVGFITKSVYNGRLQHEGWFDVQKTGQVDDRVLQSLKSNRPIELSTGLYTENEEQPGEHNGKSYSYIARNYRPDHMAILPDQVGACSLNDGCGVLINFNPDQPRGSNGQWSSGDMAAAYERSGSMKTEEIAGAHAQIDSASKETISAALKTAGFMHAAGDSKTKLATQLKKLITDRAGMAGRVYAAGRMDQKKETRNMDYEEKLSLWQKIGQLFSVDATANQGMGTLNYSPDQPRDERGMWTATGGAGTTPEASAKAGAASAKAYDLTAKATASGSTSDHAAAAMAHESAQRAYIKVASAQPAASQGSTNPNIVKSVEHYNKSLEHAAKSKVTNMDQEEKRSIWQKIGQVLGVTTNEGMGGGNFGLQKRADHANSLSGMASAASDDAKDQDGHTSAAQAHLEAMAAHKVAAREAATPAATGAKPDFEKSGSHSVKAGYHQAQADFHKSQAEPDEDEVTKNAKVVCNKCGGLVRNGICQNCGTAVANTEPMAVIHNGFPVLMQDLWYVYNRDWPQAKRDDLDESDFAGPHQSFPIKTQADVSAAAHLVGHATNPEAVKSRIKSIAERKGLSLPAAWNEESEQTSNREEGQMAKLNVGEKKAVVDFLVTNCDCWKDKDDAKVLNSFSDEKLVKLKKQTETLVANAASKATTGGGNETSGSGGSVDSGRDDSKSGKGMDKSEDLDDVKDSTGEVKKMTKNQEKPLTERLSPEELQVWNTAVRVHDRERASIVNRLVVNVADPEQKKVLFNKLAKKDINELQEMLALLPPPPANNYNRQPELAVNYFGAAGGLESVVANASDDEDILPLPTMNWDAEEAAKQA